MAARAIIAFLLLNLPFWIWGLNHYISRPWLNIELLLVVLLASKRKYISAFLALSLIWLLDISLSLSLNYHFTSPIELIRSITFLNNLKLERFFNGALIFLFCLMCVIAAFALIISPKQRIHVLTVLILIGATVSAADIVNGSSFIGTRAIRLWNGNIAFSPVIKLGLTYAEIGNDRPLKSLSERTATQSANLVQWSSAHPDRSIILIIIESWGTLNAKNTNQWLEEIFLSAIELPSAYDIRLSHVQFNGSTTDAELRELCGFAGSYRLMNISNGQDCLPEKLKKNGLFTVGLHGFSELMFDRKTWWSYIGIDEKLFAEQLNLKNNSVCGGAFAGICDEDIIQNAFFKASMRPSFVYALTLNSHLPMAKTILPDDLRKRCAEDHLTNDACSITALIGKVLVAAAKGESRASLKPMLILVGDHGPPFHELASRSSYSNKFVPSITIIPRIR